MKIGKCRRGGLILYQIFGPPLWPVGILKLVFNRKSLLIVPPKESKEEKNEQKTKNQVYVLFPDFNPMCMADRTG